MPSAVKQYWLQVAPGWKLLAALLLAASVSWVTEPKALALVAMATAVSVPFVPGGLKRAVKVLFGTASLTLTAATIHFLAGRGDAPEVQQLVYSALLAAKITLLAVISATFVSGAPAAEFAAALYKPLALWRARGVDLAPWAFAVAYAARFTAAFADDYRRLRDAAALRIHKRLDLRTKLKLAPLFVITVLRHAEGHAAEVAVNLALRGCRDVADYLEAARRPRGKGLVVALAAAGTGAGAVILNYL